MSIIGHRRKHLLSLAHLSQVFQQELFWEQAVLKEFLKLSKTGFKLAAPHHCQACFQQSARRARPRSLCAQLTARCGHRALPPPALPGAAAAGSLLACMPGAPRLAKRKAGLKTELFPCSCPGV